MMGRGVWGMVAGLIVCGCGSARPAPAPVPVVNAASGAPLAPMDDSDEPKNQPSKASQCNAFIEVINKGVDELGNAAKASDDSSPTAPYAAMATVMEGIAKKLSKVDIQDRRLKEFSGEYQAMAKRVAASSRAFIAIDPLDEPKVEAAKKVLETAVKQEDPLVDAINKYCQEP